MKIDIKNTATRKQNFRQAKVLIIDNDPDHLALIERSMKLSVPEVEPIPALSEEQAFAYLNGCVLHEWKLPKLILLDIYMPTREDGWRILQHIKSLPEPANHIPVVVLSYSDSRDDIRQAYDQGSSSYLVKPTHSDGWLTQFQMLRTYWWETVTLPQIGYTM